MGKRMLLNHIGVAVRSIDEAIKSMPGELYPSRNKTYDPSWRCNMQIWVWNGIPYELVESTTLARETKFNIYHQCYEVADIEEATRDAKEIGGIVIDGPKPAVLFNGRRVVFVQMPGHQLIEYLEEK
jgi:methylmalonyl-CoA/ethylmalonyl-CoA epimerase